MNRYPLWKYLMIVTVVALGLVYSLPNLYAPDPAVQISAESAAGEVGQAVLDKASEALEQAGIPVKAQDLEKDYVLLRLNSNEEQLLARSVIQKTLGSDYVVALNLAPTTPEWLMALGAEPMKLGLDLSGGVHFLLQVDTDAAVKKRLETDVAEMRRQLREDRIRFRSLNLQDGLVIKATFRNDDDYNQAKSLIPSKFPNLTRIQDQENAEQRELLFRMSDQEVANVEDYAVSQNLTTLRNRVNELGVSEPIVQRQGRNRVVVELPGVQDTARAKKIIGKTASLEFRLEARADTLASNRETFAFRDPNIPYKGELEKRAIIKGESVIDAYPGYDENGRPQVNIKLDSRGGTRINRATRENIQRRMGVLFIEYKTDTVKKVDENGEEVLEFVQREEKKLISLPTIQAALGVNFVITGLDNPKEASELALLLRAGALAAPMYFVEERTIGPSLGADNIAQGVISVQVGLALVLLFMLVWYRWFGFAASLALGANILLLVGLMSIIGATLTLPGIAGIVLTVGMAVDANVLIFSRIKEEFKNGMSPQQSIHEGFERAFLTIVDANITTLIVAVILYAVGSGPVQGFAVTLFLGISCSLFTSIMGTRAVVNLMYGNRNLKTLSL